MGAPARVIASVLELHAGRGSGAGGGGGQEPRLCPVAASPPARLDAARRRDSFAPPQLGARLGRRGRQVCPEAAREGRAVAASHRAPARHAGLGYDLYAGPRPAPRCSATTRPKRAVSTTPSQRDQAQRPVGYFGVHEYLEASTSRAAPAGQPRPNRADRQATVSISRFTPLKPDSLCSSPGGGEDTGLG